MLMRRAAGGCLGLALLLSQGPTWAASFGSLSTPAGLVAAALALLAAKAMALQNPQSLVAAAALVVVLFAGVGVFFKARRPVAQATPSQQGVKLGDRLFATTVLPLPGGYRREGLMDMASAHFIQLQAAWDAGDLDTLSSLTTDDILAELRALLPARDSGANRTDVLSLRADLLAFDELHATYVVSVEFSGMIRERPDESAVPFRELWMLARPKEGESGWLLARHQALL